MSQFECKTLAETQALGVKIGEQLQAGQVVILSGPLGAGKTSITQGIAKGMGVRGPITSPTFVISRIHPSLVGGPKLIHLDAYRVDQLSEIEDLDLDTDLNDAVLVAEWGAGKIDALLASNIEITIERRDDDTRLIRVDGMNL